MPHTLTENEAYALGIEAYVYAYPLVLMEATRRVATNVAAPQGALIRAPMNQFAHAPRYPDASFKDVVRPNADTLYSNVWYDVGEEPLVFTLPDTAGRYYVFPLMDMWTDVFATLGARTTGTDRTEFVLVGPRWQGSTPPGVRVVTSPTDQGWIVNRIQTNGASDYATVHPLQAQLQAVPLSRYGQPYDAPAGTVDPALDMSIPPVDAVAQMPPAEFFGLFTELMRRNPPHAADYPTLFRLERLGLKPGVKFVLADAPAAVQTALARAAKDALPYLLQTGARIRPMRNGWNTPFLPIGTFGNDYVMRALTAFAGLGALPAREAIYPRATHEADGTPLTGASRYVLHFDQAELPPADAFWSLTMYGADQFFVDNPIHRYTIGDRDPLAYNADGSLDIYIQHDAPANQTNWLPAPAGNFSMNLRLYLPRAEALDGRWVAPVLRKA